MAPTTGRKGRRNRSNRLAIPSVRCSATSRSTGESCRRYAVPGTTVCHFHGGNVGNLRNAAGERNLLATLLAGEPRPVWVALLDAVATADALARERKMRLIEGEPVTLDLIDRLSRYAQLVHTMSTHAITARAHEMQAQHVQVEGETVGWIIRAVVTPLLDGLGLRDGLGPRDGFNDDARRRLSTWVSASLRVALEAVSAGARQEDIARAVTELPPLDGITLVVATDVDDVTPPPDPDDPNPPEQQARRHPDHGPPGPDLTAVRPADTGPQPPQTGAPGVSSPDEPPSPQTGPSGTSPTLRWPPGVPDLIHVALAGISVPAGRAADPASSAVTTPGSVVNLSGNHLDGSPPSSDGSADKSPDPDPADIIEAELIDDDDDAIHATERAFLRAAGLGLLPSSSIP